MITAKNKKVKKRRSIPKELIYEVRYGSPIYYREYDKVLSGEKTLEEVMGSSKLQWVIIYLIFKYLVENLDRRKYLIATNKAGFQWAPRSWRNLDIAIFDREKLLKGEINDKLCENTSRGSY
ncbi:MAG: hypothetical protein Q9M89_05580 [Persephonella sp.]|nr:hypothetical protein [Persephonella sp.]